MRSFLHLISDVVMHPMNGIEAAIAIRRLHPECTILFIPGNQNAKQLISEARALGNEFEVLAKAVHPELILDRLRNDHKAQ